MTDEKSRNTTAVDKKKWIRQAKRVALENFARKMLDRVIELDSMLHAEADEMERMREEIRRSHMNADDLAGALKDANKAITRLRAGMEIVLRWRNTMRAKAAEGKPVVSTMALASKVALNEALQTAGYPDHNPNGTGGE